MLITEAINTLERVQHEPWEIPRDVLQKAMALGAEALKTIKAERTIYGYKRLVALPGDTQETGGG